MSACPAPPVRRVANGCHGLIGSFKASGFACLAAQGLAWLAYRVDRRHREVARENLVKAFPGQYTDAELDRMVRAVYRHFCTLLVEIVHIPRKLHVTNWKQYIDLNGGAHLKRYPDVLGHVMKLAEAQ